MTNESELDLLKRLFTQAGWRFVVGEDGIERAIRPDGSVAITAERRTSDEDSGDG